MKTFAIAAILLAVSAGTASADWQYTRWGMTESEVARASNGQASRCRTSPQAVGVAIIPTRSALKSQLAGRARRRPFASLTIRRFCRWPSSLIAHAP